MQNGANSESSFEFVERKLEGISLVDNALRQEVPTSASLVPPAMSSPLVVEPPSALPSFIESPSTLPSSSVVNTSDATSAGPNTDPGFPSASVAPNSAASAFYPKTFSPAIPASQGSDASLSTADSALEGDNAGVSSQLLGWVKGAVGGSAGILSRVTEKAKHSMNSMITTLDPQMKELVLDCGGSVNIIVASDKEMKVSPIRQAFQGVFGKATVTGLPVNSSVTASAAQPVGFAAGVRAAEERICVLRNTHNIPTEQTVLAVENFLVEIGENKWFDVGVLLLNDPSRGITLETFTQLTPVPAAVVALAKDETPKKYPFQWSGLGVTVGSIMANNLQVHHSEWHQALTGVSRREMIFLSAKVLAGLYKSSVAVGGPML